MTTFNITLTSAEVAALSVVAVSPNEWVQAFVKERSRVAADEIVQVTVAKCLETQQPIPNSKDLMVEMALSNGWVKTAAQAHAEYVAELEAAEAARLAAEQNG